MCLLLSPQIYLPWLHVSSSFEIGILRRVCVHSFQILNSSIECVFSKNRGERWCFQLVPKTKTDVTTGSVFQNALLTVYASCSSFKAGELLPMCPALSNMPRRCYMCSLNYLPDLPKFYDDTLYICASESTLKSPCLARSESLDFSTTFYMYSWNFERVYWCVKVIQEFFTTLHVCAALEEFYGSLFVHALHL